MGVSIKIMGLITTSKSKPICIFASMGKRRSRLTNKRITSAFQINELKTEPFSYGSKYIGCKTAMVRSFSSAPYTSKIVSPTPYQSKIYPPAWRNT